MDRNSSKWPLFGRLKKAVKKLNIILNFSSDFVTKSSWRIASIFRSSISTRNVPQRRLSFDDRPGLREVYTDQVETNETSGVVGSDHVGFVPSPDQRVLERTVSSPISERHLVQRTPSFPMEDDVDKRAEMFIKNFYKQLKLQRQISLELRYCRSDSFDSSASPSPS